MKLISDGVNIQVTPENDAEIQQLKNLAALGTLVIPDYANPVLNIKLLPRKG